MPNAITPTRAPLHDRVLRVGLFVVGLSAIGYLLGSAAVPCGFARMFHAPCPGCGSTRAMLALRAGDWPAFLHYNPLAPLMTALLLLLAVQATLSLAATGTFQRVGDGKIGLLVSRGVLLVVALEVLLWLARFGGLLGGPVPV